MAEMAEWHVFKLFLGKEGGGLIFSLSIQMEIPVSKGL